MAAYRLPYIKPQIVQLSQDRRNEINQLQGEEQKDGESMPQPRLSESSSKAAQ